MAGQTLARGESGQKEQCVTCNDTKWAPYTTIRLDGTAEVSQMLCECNYSQGYSREQTEVRYGMEPDIRCDGDERYFVYAYFYEGGLRVSKQLVTVTGSYSSAARDIDALRNEGRQSERGAA